MEWVNGQLQSWIPVDDRGLTLGDGFFTTIQIWKGKPLLWELHQARLSASAERLQLSLTEPEQLYDRLLSCVADVYHGSAKIIITRGSGPRGYGIRACQAPREIISVHDYPTIYQQWQQSGIPLAVCQGRLGASPLVAGLKCLGRLEQVLLKAELETRGAVEGVVLDIDDNIVETVTANVFWRRDSVVYTPALQASGVSGVMRAWIMQQLAQSGLVCRQLRAGLAALQSADEVFISNALMEVVPVTGIEDVTYHDHSLARQLQAAFCQTTKA